LVIMAMATTFMASPLFEWLMRRESPAAERSETLSRDNESSLMTPEA
ncbi:MAG: hypothetical protein JWO08_240, partial [Verrucomicrobiaceae bacterium]|nr:hypothetical protein [Verrucomicrobiaceae bacterium]